MNIKDKVVFINPCANTNLSNVCLILLLSAKHSGSLLKIRAGSISEVSPFGYL